VTPSVATPADTNPSDATVAGSADGLANKYVRKSVSIAYMAAVKRTLMTPSVSLLVS